MLPLFRSFTSNKKRHRAKPQMGTQSQSKGNAPNS